MKRLALLRCMAALAIVGLGLAGCSRAQSLPVDAEPATLRPIAGTDLQEVTLTGDAVEDLGIESEPVRKAASGVTQTVMPVAAVIYDPKGNAWAYTVKGPGIFVRKHLAIDHMSGQDAYLTSGPPVGTLVVTVGAPELLGAENGVGDE